MIIRGCIILKTMFFFIKNNNWSGAEILTNEITIFQRKISVDKKVTYPWSQKGISGQKLSGI